MSKLNWFSCPKQLVEKGRNYQLIQFFNTSPSSKNRRQNYIKDTRILFILNKLLDEGPERLTLL